MIFLKSAEATVKLAATSTLSSTMNPHYHPYGQSELTSPHPPSPDNGNYPHHMHPSNGHHMMHHQNMGGEMGGMPPHPAFGGNNGQQGGPQHMGHHINNNNNNNGTTVKVCAGCGGKIVERFLLHALDRYWHNGCLKCSCCGAMLADIGTSCFTKGGMILCKNDYMR